MNLEMVKSGYASTYFIWPARRALDGGKPSQAQEHLKQLSEILTQYVQVKNITSHASEVLQANIAYLLANGIQ